MPSLAGLEAASISGVTMSPVSTASGLEPASILAEEEPTSDRYGFAAAYLERERNRVAEALLEARQAAARLLQALEIRW